MLAQRQEKAVFFNGWPTVFSSPILSDRHDWLQSKESRPFFLASDLIKQDRLAYVTSFWECPLNLTSFLTSLGQKFSTVLSIYHQI